ncbi:MAG TPA: SAM-dependent DNA methyltransferase [Ignavibacteria bacterium]|nr:SAM-dependent DNA methyltransferase [Ignavibacteria bacterium]
MSVYEGTGPLEKWILDRYYAILSEFEGKTFGSKDIELFLGKDSNLRLDNISEFLSTLSKERLVTVVKVGAKNTKLYKINRITNCIEVSKGTTKDQIIRILKTGADLIRGRVDYRVLLVLLFYKALSDRWMAEVRKFYQETQDWKAAYHLANISKYYLYDENTEKLHNWDEATKDKINLMQNFITSLNQISEMNPKLADIKLLVSKLGLTSFVNHPDNVHTFMDLINLFSKINVEDADYDVLGSAYEWILSYFAQSIAKAGEIFTPREVIQMMIEILDIRPDSDILDPASGSGSMLIEAHKYVSKKYKDGKTLKLEGQEFNDINTPLSKINLLMHGIENYVIHLGDSLTGPKFKKTDFIISNPPWNLDGYDERKVNVEGLKDIYNLGFTNKQSADWLWIQLMLHNLRKKAAIILDNGALFRGGKEQNIRKNLIENYDLLEAIILLPEKLFYNTGAPGAILIFNKEKELKRHKKVLFINASLDFEKHPEVRKLNALSEQNIKKIVQTYNDFKEEEGFSKIVDYETLKQKEYNFNVTLYAFPKTVREEINIRQEWSELAKKEKELSQLEKKIEGFLEEVGI